ncbi:MAG: Peptidylprolyl isomerase [Planctomycetota bacterium]|nr:Peptidylprolyl isomerase [Planctomycetota bacterium]
MSAKDRRRNWAVVAAAVVTTGVLGSGSAPGQGPADGRVPIRGTKPATKPAVTGSAPAADTEIKSTIVRMPSNPGDAVAVVNGETITRQRLADETVVRKGDEVLDAMISRILIDQAMRARKLSVTAQEIDAEVDRVVGTISGGNVTKEEWFRNLAKERKISPVQYKNDIVYPGLALKKLAENRVQVTDQDMKDAFDAHFGEGLRCRIIMCMRERDALDICNELAKNPGGFTYIAQNDQRSVDQATKPLGGLLPQPLTRHAFPRNVSDKAFLQLVDGEPGDRDPAHKPKDGDISGPIQVTASTWIVIKREGLIPAKAQDRNEPNTKARLKTLIYEAKLKEAMSEVFDELVQASEVQNHLTGQTKLAHEEKNPDHRVDGKVQLMSQQQTESNPPAAGTSAARAKAAAASVKPEDRAAKEAFQKNAAVPAPK